MRLALVNPPYGQPGRSMRPLGLMSLAAFVDDRLGDRIETTVYEFSDCDRGDHSVLNTYDVLSADVIGLSAYSSNFPIALDWAHAIRHGAPHARTVIGGHHATHVVDRLLTVHADAFDYVVCGEGELPLVGLLEALLAGDEWPDAVPFVFHRESPPGPPTLEVHVPGAVDRRLASPEGTLITAKGMLVRDLDEVPPPIANVVSPYNRPLTFYDKREHRMRSAAAIVSSRGCPFGCGFCTLRRNKYRAVSPARALEWLEALEAAEDEEFEHVYFMDALLFTQPSRVFELGEMLQAYRPGVTFSGSARADQLVRVGGDLARLAALGLRFVEVGVEAGSARALARYGKGNTVDQNLEAVRQLQRAGVDIALDFIMFYPDAVVDDLRDNLDFLRRAGLTELLPHDHYYTYLTPYVGTPLRPFYEEMLGGERFPLDDLPVPDELFVEDDVRRVFRRFVRDFAPTRARVARLIETVEPAALRARTNAPALAQRLRLEAITLRHVPFLALAALCDGDDDSVAEIERWVDELGEVADSLDEVLAAA